jgi:Fe-S cluster assembly ATPase SufC
MKFYSLGFENISLSVKGKSILKGVSGYFPKGRLTAIMGPSGNRLFSSSYLYFSSVSVCVIESQVAERAVS